MKETRRLHQRGFTLVEVVIAILVLSIISLGVFSFQVHAVKQTKRAAAKMTAAGIGSLILENWKSAGGAGTYDPTVHNFGISKLSESIYQLTVDGIPFYFRFSHQDIDTNAMTGVTLRELRVVVQWRSDYQQLIPVASDPISAYYTYVRRDQSGG